MPDKVIPLKRPDHAQGVKDALTLLKVLVLGGHSLMTINDVILKAEDSLAKLQEQNTRR